MSLVDTEHVLVIPTELFHSIGHFQGFCGDTEKYLDEILSPEVTSYRPRRDMENDPSFKQLIPYVIFRYRDERGVVSVFQYTRGNGQGEQRLHSKRSIGVGGHISSDDAVELNPYDEGMRRELEEEVVIETGFQGRLVGMINDDESEVGKVHLGVVHIMDVEKPNVSAREDDITHAGFQEVSSLVREADQFETWSRICLESLFNSESLFKP